ncbi:MAG: cell envelope integrity protein TolA [Gammaproteobacteria bacterium]|nr:cell envelope integrity protein TolA [Gammaproteobacteria bacterium]
MESKYNPSLLISVVLHIAVLLMLILSFEFSSPMPVLENGNQDMKVISATVMNAPPLPSLPEPSPAMAEPVKPHVAQPPPPPPPPQPDVQKLQQAQKQQAIEIQKQQAIALKLLRKKQLALQKAELEKQLLDDVKKQTVKEKAQKQKVLQKAMEKELKAEAAKALQQQLMGEQRRAGSAKARGEVNKYKALILQAISRRWLVPSGVNRELSSELLIRLAPGGTVLDVRVTRSSGDASLDRSARDAVFKASPLPVPDDADGFDQFRQFVLKVKPTDLIASDY